MDVAGRAGARLRSSARGACDALLVTKLVEHPLPHRLHRVGRSAARAARRGACSSPTAATASRPPSSSAAAGVDAAHRDLAPTGQREAGVRGRARRGIAAARARGRRASPGRSSGRYAERGSPTPSWSPTEGLVDGLRLVKDDGEVARIAAAASIADEALADVRPTLLERPDRAGLRHRARHRDPPPRRRGQLVRDDRRPPDRTAPSPTPDRRTGASSTGDLVVLDFGAVVDGYCSDMTRTVMVGEPSPTQAAHARGGHRRAAGRGRRRRRRRRRARRRRGLPAA